MQVPTIITVYDSKLHKIAETVVEYDEYEDLVLKIKPTCEKNLWFIKAEVPATEKVFKMMLGL